MTRQIAAGLTALVFAVALAAATLAGYRWAQGVYERELAEAERRAEKEAALMRERIHEQAAAFEALRTEKRKTITEVRHELERVVERPVYLDCAVDDDGLRLINAALGLSGAATEPGGSVPGARADDRPHDGRSHEEAR